MFGNESLPSRIYTYGCLEPTEGLDRFEDQVAKMHAYQNNLVRAERDRREAVDQALRQLRPGLLDLDEEVARAEAALQEARKVLAALNSERQSRRATADERRPARDAAAHLKAVRKRLADGRKEAFAAADVKSALTAVEESDAARRKQLRATSCLYWGNYLAIEQAAQSYRKGPPPQFRRWRWGEGRIAVQIQGGLSITDALAGTSNQLQVMFDRNTPGDRRPFYNVRLRVGSEGPGGRKAVWVTVPAVFSRLPPDDSVIKWAYLHRRHRGAGWRWEVQLVLSRQLWGREDEADDGAVGIDVGWRLLPGDDLRVAYWFASDGRSGQVVIPKQDLYARWTLPDELRSTRDTHFNDYRGRLVAFIAQRRDGGGTFPEWFEKESSSLSQWRSQGRLARLMERWRDNRFDGDEEIFRTMFGWKQLCPDGRYRYMGWYLQDRHFLNWEDNVRQRAIRWRDDLYRRIVVELRRLYKTAIIEDTDWSKMARRQDVEEAKAENETARRHRHIAAPGRLSELIRDGFAETTAADPAYSTQTCAHCHRMDAFDAAEELVRLCRHCGNREDQDSRAARNLLAAGLPQDDVPAAVNT